jgi:drug/metabolite transporter (DMT)-like permease
MTTTTASAHGGSLGAGLALAASGSIAFSGKAIIVKLAYRHGVDAVTLIMYRMLFALPLFLALAWWARRGKPALEPRDWRTVVFLGFTGYYLASFLDFAGLQYITASLERLILYLNPTLVLLIGALLFKRPVTPAQLGALVVSASLTAQTGMIGPLATITLGVFVLGEPFNRWVVAGTALVLLGVWLLARASRPR